ncbi:SDR family oxidoreductase [Bradyrhizobium sediminis]|uniref:SDR family oxidoreductase n=1 Tax=Bradyrhizobium sediminis TaxID=2840469 RepID=A0A975NY82_9BRAD|nr:SDR family oxidoreductase [Bradyrhizobium sediminis]QWG23165.1 SDR family oxidoreductase [Bradyrhizobium sediminis]
MTSNARPLALVTGASSGIGADLARELARDGHDLILCARRVGPMQALADELKAAGCHCTVIAADLSQSGAAASLVREIESRGLVVDVLVNNAGLGSNGRFNTSDPLRIAEILQVNVVALTELTRLLLPNMVERRKGKVMMVASTAAFQPGPKMAVYCATKTYVLSFGEAIAYELRNSGVSVTTLCPGATATEFAHVADAESAALFKGLLPVMDAKKVARIGYQGFKAGRRVVITGLLNKIMAISSRLSPTPVATRIASWMMSAGK